MPISRGAFHLGSMTWGQKPLATACAGCTAYFTDVGCNGGGSMWYSDGVRWRAKGGSVLLQCLLAAATTASNTIETMAQTSLLPAGLIQLGDQIAYETGASKALGGSSITTLHCKLGIGSGGAASTSDQTIITNNTPASANQAAFMSAGVMRIANNATPVSVLRRSTWQTPPPYAVGSAYPADTAITGILLDSVPVYLSIALANNTASEISALQFSRIRLLT